MNQDITLPFVSNAQVIRRICVRGLSIEEEEE